MPSPSRRSKRSSASLRPDAGRTATPSRSHSRTNAEPTTTISFRLDATFTEQLTERAALHGLSRGDYARLFVVEHLSNAETLRLQAELADLKSQFKNLRDDMATSVVALLVKAGKSSHEEAVAWVKKTLLQ